MSEKLIVLSFFFIKMFLKIVSKPILLKHLLTFLKMNIILSLLFLRKTRLSFTTNEHLHQSTKPLK